MVDQDCVLFIFECAIKALKNKAGNEHSKLNIGKVGNILSN